MQRRGRGPRDAVPAHETEGNTRGHPGWLSRVSDIDTQCCDPSRYLVRWFLKTVPWTPTICWPCRDAEIAIMMGDSDRIARAISCSIVVRLLFANLQMDLVSQRRWGFNVWDRITCDCNGMAKYSFSNSFVWYILGTGDRFIYHKKM